MRGLLIMSLIISQQALAQGSTCESVLSKYGKTRSEVESYKFSMPGMKISSVSDPSLSTGVTFFQFPEGALAAVDSRGGSVGSIENDLLAPGSYSANIDGIMFSGGSTMGLEASSGARARIFAERANQAGNFDFIPSVPGAVVYDFGNRIEKNQEKLVYPTVEMGVAAYDSTVEGEFLRGRAGAGTSTTANKISSPIWGGQGASLKEINLGAGLQGKVFAAVILNAHGDVYLPNGEKVNEAVLQELRKQEQVKGHRKNTTLSLVVTDLDLDRNQLQRLAAMVHTNMAKMISPFHTYTDGDVCYAVSLRKVKIPDDAHAYGREERLQMAASAAMSEAIVSSVRVANSGGDARGTER